MKELIAIKIIITIISIFPFIILCFSENIKEINRDTIIGMIALFIVCLSADFSNTTLNIISLMAGFLLGFLNKEK